MVETLVWVTVAVSGLMVVVAVDTEVIVAD